MIEQSTKIVEINNFINFIISLSPLEKRHLLSKKSLSFLASFFRHLPRERGLHYDPNVRITPLSFALFDDKNRTAFLRDFGCSKRFQPFEEIQCLNVTISELVFCATDSFFSILMTDFSELFLEASTDDMFMLFMKKACFFQGHILTQFDQTCKNFHESGNRISSFWGVNHHSSRVRDNRKNLILYSNNYFLTDVVNYYNY